MLFVTDIPGRSIGRPVPAGDLLGTQNPDVVPDGSFGCDDRWGDHRRAKQLGPAMRLLLIDDDPVIGMFVERVAGMMGFEVRATTEATAFKSACVDFDPQVISLDLSMPECDGIELLRYLADIRCRAQILIASSFHSKVLQSARDLGMERGLNMAGVLPKPLDVDQLQDILSAVREAAGHG
jgi:DNA-binding response OmpR family regulator